MPPKKGGGGGRQRRRNHSLDPTNQRTKAPLSSTTTAKTTKEPSAQNTMFINEQRPTRLGPNIAPLILEGAKLNKMELNDVIKSHFGDVNIRNIQLGKTLRMYCHDRFRPNLTDSSDGLHNYSLFSRIIFTLLSINWQIVQLKEQ